MAGRLGVKVDARRPSAPVSEPTYEYQEMIPMSMPIVTPMQERHESPVQQRKVLTLTGSEDMYADTGDGYGSDDSAFGGFGGDQDI